MAPNKGKPRRVRPQAVLGDSLVRLRSGPRKERSSEPRPPRLTMHKQRAAWFRARVTWPMREAPIEKLQTEVARLRGTMAAATPASNWQLAGPTNIGGRCTALVCDPANADHIWIGAAVDGVWASQDAGRDWVFKWENDGPLQIGSLAIDPSNAKTLYCGTGEANLSADSYPGDGLYRSTDSGTTWTAWAPSARTGLPRRIVNVPRTTALRS